MLIESQGQVCAASSKGALGLMQIMPTTYAGLRLRYGLGSDALDAHDNIMAGAAYLRELYDQFGLPGALAAYNAGPGRWLEHLATGHALPLETQVYVARLTPVLQSDGALNARQPSIRPLLSPPSVFVQLAVTPPFRSFKTTQIRSAPPPPVPPSTPSLRFAPQSDGLFAPSSQGVSPP